MNGLGRKVSERATGLLAHIPVGPLLAVLAVAGLWLLSGAPTAADRVPDLTGIDVNAAIAEAANNGYGAQVVMVEGGGLAGTVIRQEPVAGQIRERGTEITLEVTQGRHQVEVPDVRGMPVEDARRRLEEAHLSPGDVAYREDPGIEENRVVTTDPGPGNLVDVGSRVDIVAAA